MIVITNGFLFQTIYALSPYSILQMMSQATGSIILQKQIKIIPFRFKKPNEPNELYKVDWLSVRLSIDTDTEHYEYDMDEFISTFVICSTDKIPSLSCFLCHGAYIPKNGFHQMQLLYVISLIQKAMNATYLYTNKIISIFDMY